MNGQVEYMQMRKTSKKNKDKKKKVKYKIKNDYERLAFIILSFREGANKFLI